MFVFQIVLGFIIIFFEMRRNKQMPVDLMSICNVVFLICFVIAPISGFYMLEDWQLYSVMRYTYKGIQYGTDSFYITGAMCLIGYLLFLFTFKFTKGGSVNNRFSNVYGYRIHPSKILIFASIILILAMLALIVESLKVGGPLKWMVSNPRLYHAGDAEDIESSSWLLDKVIKLSIVSSYLLWGVLMISKKRLTNSNILNKTFLIRLLFILSIIISTAVVIHAGGRFLLFQYFATFFIANLIYSQKGLRLVPILLILFFGSFVLLYGRTFFKLFIYDDALALIDNDGKTSLDYFFGVMNNYTFPFFSFNNNINVTNWNFNYFIDFFIWPVNFLPTAFRPSFYFDSTAINTYNLLNEYRRFIPTDIYSYGFINLGFFGVIVCSIFFGWIVRKVNFLGFINNPISVIIYVVLAFLLGFRIMYFDPYHFFKGSFEIILSLSLIGFLNEK